MPRYLATTLLLSWGIRIVAAQAAAVPSTWLGVWILNYDKSKFDEHSPVAIVSQTLTLAVNGEELTVAGDTVTSDGRQLHETSQARLDGTETPAGPGIVASFKRVDDRSFEVIVTGRGGSGSNRFVFSTDGKTFTETKTLTLTGAAVTTSTSVLVFEKRDPERR